MEASNQGGEQLRAVPARRKRLLPGVRFGGAGTGRLLVGRCRPSSDRYPGQVADRHPNQDADTGSTIDA
jgi:hypothetical protein